MAQSLVTLLAISALLGRIYALRYFGTLGLPSTAVNLQLFEYVLFAPDTAIMSVSIAISTSVVLAVILISPRRDLKKLEAPAWLVGSLIAMSVLLILMSAFTFEHLSRYPGLVGLTVAVSFFSAMWAGVLFPSSVSLAKGSVGSQMLPVAAKIVIPFLVGILVFTLSLISTTNLAEVRARLDRTNQPEAKIEFVDSDMAAATRDSGITGGKTSRLGRVVLQDSQLIYFMTEEGAPGATRTVIRAIPMRHISAVHYY